MSKPTSGNRIIFADDFSTDGPIRSSKWDFNHWSQNNNSSFYGNTQQRQELPRASNGKLELRLDTYNPTGNPRDPSFLGSEAITDQKFDVGNGIAFEARMRFGQDQRGIVGGFFTFAGPADKHDEIDFEAMSNRINEIQTNIYHDEPLGNGHPVSYPITGSLTDFHTYRIEWFPDVVRWLVDDELVRTETVRVPTKPMPMHLNIWGPKADWDIGDPSLKAVSNKSQNSTFELYVDSLKVEQLSSKVGTSAAENLQGTAKNDHLDGQSGADHLFGGAGHDTVYGDGGADRITGGIGADHLWGGPQSDTFIYTRIAESTVDASRQDVIEDFSRLQGDRIDLSAIDANVGLEGNQMFSFIGTSAFRQTTGELRYEFVDGQTHASGDVTGDGIADFSIRLRGQHAVEAGYFVP